MIQAYLDGEVRKSKAHLEEMKSLSDAKQTKLEAEMKESKAHLDAFNLKMPEELAGKNEEVERFFWRLEVQGEELQDKKLHEMEEELKVSLKVVKQYRRQYRQLGQVNIN